MKGIVSRAKFIQKRKQQDPDWKPRADFNHVLMLGPPGVGKSTVKDAIAQTMALIGATKHDRSKKITPSDIAGQYTGDAAVKIKEILDGLDGGVLMVDEAHRFNDNKFTRNGLGALIDPMADPDQRNVIVFAGYPDKMKEMFAENDPGLESRFAYVLGFKRYDADTLVDIAFDKLKDDRATNKDKRAERAMEKAIEAITNDPEHGSGRDVESIIRFAQTSVADRAEKDPKVPLSVFTAADWVYAQKEFLKQRALI